MLWFFSTPRSGPAFGSLPVCSTRSAAAPPKASLTTFGSGLRLHSVTSRLAQSRPLAQTPVQKRGCLSCLVPCYPYIHPGIQQAETVGHGFLSSFAELFFLALPTINWNLISVTDGPLCFFNIPSFSSFYPDYGPSFLCLFLFNLYAGGQVRTHCSQLMSSNKMYQEQHNLNISCDRSTFYQTIPQMVI